MMNNRTAIIIDGAMFEMAKRRVMNHRPFDFNKLIQSLSGSDELVAAYYYNAHPTREWKANPFFHCLSYVPHLELKMGRLVKQIVKGIEIPRQKRVDTMISCDIALLACNKLVDSIHLFCGDDDFVPPVQLAVQEGVTIHLYYNPESFSEELFNWASVQTSISEEWITQFELKGGIRAEKIIQEYGSIDGLLAS